MKNLRIGILIREFTTLQNWELRIIENIKNYSNLELVLLIKDGRVKKEGSSKNKKYIFPTLRFKNYISAHVFKMQTSIEEKRYLSIKYSVDRDQIIRYLDKVPTVELNPKLDGSIEIFSIEDSKKIFKYKLDIILKHGFNIISGKILNVSKYGIWYLNHGGGLINRKGPHSFWEIVLKQPVVVVSLQQLTEEKDVQLVIDKAYYNIHRHFSFFLTNRMINEASVSLLFKNFKNIDERQLKLTKSDANSNIKWTYPNLLDISKYLKTYYQILFKKALEKTLAFFGKRYDCWTLFIGNGDFLDTNLSKLQPVKLPKGEFWADPFIFKYKNENYAFFENYSYKTKRGKISCGRIIDNKIVDVINVLDLGYHMSYPFIFEEDGKIFLMPETMQNNRLEIYRCIDFPVKWELYSTAFEGEFVADANFFKDKLNQKWLFLNKKLVQITENTSDLYIYKVDSLKLDKIEPHKQNPVITDSRVARNGGAIFEYKNKIFRPSQSNINGVYGKTLNINHIEKLTINEYVEIKIKTIEPDFEKGLVSTHHLHQIDGMFILDAAYKRI